MDSLEVMAYDWLGANGIGFDEITVRYMGSTPEAVEAFKAGAIDWICTVEPYVTALARDVSGAHVLSNGRDIYGAGYTDCVLTAQRTILERDPSAVKAVIKALMKAQHAFETERDQVLRNWSAPTTRPRSRTPASPPTTNPSRSMPGTRPTSFWSARTACARWATSPRSLAATSSTGRCSRR
jgi:NMT1-like family